MPLVQHLVQEIYLGHLVYSPTTSRPLISDLYVSERTKVRRRASSPSGHRLGVTLQGADGGPSEGQGSLAEVYIYDPYEAGWLDHSRLRVPRWRQWIEFSSFGVLLILFLFTLAREICLPGCSNQLVDPKPVCRKEPNKSRTYRGRLHCFHPGLHVGGVRCFSRARLDW